MSSHRVSCRHGRRFDFDPVHTAFLAIDMQKDFLFDAEGRPNRMAEIVPNFRRLTALIRRLDSQVIHTRESYRPDLSDVSPLKASMDYVGRPGPLGRRLVRGEAGCDFVEELKPAGEELVLDKPGFGAFCSTDLGRILEQAGVTHLILAGVTTQCCVQSTLREAVDRGFWCLTVADCCAAPETAWHAAALELIASEDHLFGWICELDDLVQACG